MPVAGASVALFALLRRATLSGFATINRVLLEPRAQAGYIVRQVFVGAEHQGRTIVHRPGDAAKNFALPAFIEVSENQVPA